MTATARNTEDAMLEAETELEVGSATSDMARYVSEFDFSQRMVRLSQQGAYTNVSLLIPGPVHAGQLLPPIVYYLSSGEETFSQGSTVLVNAGPQTEETVRGHFDWLIFISADEVFFDGRESRLSYGLKHLMRVEGHATLRVIRSLLDAGKLNTETVGEILRVLGDFDDRGTHSSIAMLATGMPQI